MKDEEGVRFIFPDSKATKFIYRLPKHGTKGTRFAQKGAILDDLWLVGGTRLDRIKHRLKHPIVYSKRSLRSIYRSIKRLFVKESTIPYLWFRVWKSKEEMSKSNPEI